MGSAALMGPSACVTWGTLGPIVVPSVTHNKRALGTATAAQMVSLACATACTMGPTVLWSVTQTLPVPVMDPVTRQASVCVLTITLGQTALFSVLRLPTATTRAPVSTLPLLGQPPANALLTTLGLTAAPSVSPPPPALGVHVPPRDNANATSTTLARIAQSIARPPRRAVDMGHALRQVPAPVRLVSSHQIAAWNVIPTHPAAVMGPALRRVLAYVPPTISRPIAV